MSSQNGKMFIYSYQSISSLIRSIFLPTDSPVVEAIIYLNSGGEVPARRHMAAVELRLPGSRRLLCLGRITSCWVPLRGDTFKAAALGAAGATSGDRLHTLPQALHFFSLSFLSLCLFWCLN